MLTINSEGKKMIAFNNAMNSDFIQNYKTQINCMQLQYNKKTKLYT